MMGHGVNNEPEDDDHGALSTLPEEEDFTAEHVRIAIPVIEPEASRHLRRLVANWGLLADLSFSDLLLYVPLNSNEPAPLTDKAARSLAPKQVEYVIANQVRPNTTQTLFLDDVVGRAFNGLQRPVVHQAFTTGEICTQMMPVEEEATDLDVNEVYVEAVPVRHQGDIVAILCRESVGAPARHRAGLERIYAEIFRRLISMVAEGKFPDQDEEVLSEGGPRVGDGVVLLDENGSVLFTSPNANSALRRLGVTSQIVGETLADIGAESSVTYRSFFGGRPAVEEIERGETTIILWCIPLTEAGRVTGAALLLRDISELRNRDRMLVSKDATIKEIHHRVKNNLQTISSLLRLQGRRLTEPSAKAAIEESVRRIRSIALVHETLSREDGDEVDFGSIVRPLVRMVEDGLSSPDRPIRFQIHGNASKLPSPVATSLAVVLTELLQNVMDHAYPVGTLGPDEQAQINIGLETTNGTLIIVVSDDGVGIDPGFASEQSGSLGLSIVRGLIAELEGTIEFMAGTAHSSDPSTPVISALDAVSESATGRPGTSVRLVVPINRALPRNADRPPRGGGRSVGL